MLFYQDNRFADRLKTLGIRTLIWESERARERPVTGGLRRPRQLAALLRAIARRIRLLLSERIALLHLNNAPGIGFDDWLPAAKLLGIPAVSHARLQFAMPRRLWRGFVTAFDRVVAISQEIERFLLIQGIPPERIVQIYDGIDAEALNARVDRDAADVRRELFVAPDETLVALVGHLRPWKGQDVALEAVRRLAPEARARLKLVLVGGVGRGDEAYAARLRETIAQAALPVSVLGERADVPAIMQAADIVLHASTTPEPFGLVVVEAMALGRAVVAAALGGPVEIVTPESGVLFDPTRPESLTAALEALAQDPERRRRLGEGGRKRAEEFSLRRNVESVQALYRSLNPVQRN